MVEAVSKHIESAHEPEQGLHLSLHDCPVLLEEEEGQDSSDLLVAKTLSELSIWALVSETTVGLFLITLVLHDVELGGLQEAISRVVSRDDILDDESGGVSNCSLRSGDLESNAHAITSLESLDDVHAGERALSQVVNKNLVILLNLLQVYLGDKAVELILQLLVQGFILQRSLVKQLLEASLLDCLEGNIVQLSDHIIGEVRQILDVPQLLDDIRSPALGFLELCHQ